MRSELGHYIKLILNELGVNWDLDEVQNIDRMERRIYDLEVELEALRKTVQAMYPPRS